MGPLDELKLMHLMQSEVISNVPVWIGAEELRLLCYNAILDPWMTRSCNFILKLLQLILCDKDLGRITAMTDAIRDQFYKARTGKNAAVHKFKEYVDHKAAIDIALIESETRSHAAKQHAIHEAAMASISSLKLAEKDLHAEHEATASSVADASLPQESDVASPPELDAKRVCTLQSHQKDLDEASQEPLDAGVVTPAAIDLFAALEAQGGHTRIKLIVQCLSV
ncbi:hypothetical protein WOLCODRAFT_20867 [Wolfiporia cocos MD-104 SS10]|uniref:Uncharacterized protein n=1 Tax=Wolfiporia cocos (strain MD-104) TaxID=742152 RepID=A0A2H3J426_WOLCO|nr:hypothetical protein WOLCODRAFT_20867 [Wolfiporia cocos MD-104 SS10]